MPKCATCGGEIESEYIECPTTKEMFHFRCARAHVKKCSSFHRRKVVRVIRFEDEEEKLKEEDAAAKKKAEKPKGNVKKSKGTKKKAKRREKK